MVALYCKHPCIALPALLYARFESGWLCSDDIQSCITTLFRYH